MAVTLPPPRWRAAGKTLRYRVYHGAGRGPLYSVARIPRAAVKWSDAPRVVSIDERSSGLHAVAATPRTMTLRITCFGDLRVELSGRDVTRELPGRQGRALFAYLVLAGRPVHRDKLLEALWPAEQPARPEAAFGSVLSKVRKALPEGVLAGRESLCLELPPDAAVDVDDVTESVARAERSLGDADPAAALEAAQAALDVLARPLLPALSGEWLDEARNGFEGVRLRALEIVARAGIALGAPAALAAAER